jgi:hypothetical protein
MSLTTKEKARNYVWSRIESTERDLELLERDIMDYKEGTGILTMDHLENAHRAAKSRQTVFNYLFKLIETDEE